MCDTMASKHTELARPGISVVTSRSPLDLNHLIFLTSMIRITSYFFSCCAALAVSFCSSSIDFCECSWSPRSALTYIVTTTLARILSHRLGHGCVAGYTEAAAQ
jgi:hypothetical protein